MIVPLRMERSMTMLNDLIVRIAELVSVLFPFDCMEPMFMKRALLGLLLIAPLAALSGNHVINSNMSFFSDAVGHSVFAGAALGLIFSLPVNLTMPAVGLLVGILLMLLKSRSRLSTDAIIGIIFSAIVAFGLAIVSRNRAASRNINMFLYGDILTIDNTEIVLLAVLLIVFVVFQIIGWNRMLHISVNSQIATVHRIPVNLYQFVFTALLSLVVILCVRAVGVLLVTAILIVPAATARNLSRNCFQLFYWSLIVSYVCCIAGLLLSAQPAIGIPAGSAIVLTACAVFAVSFVVACIRNRRTR